MRILFAVVLLLLGASFFGVMMAWRAEMEGINTRATLAAVGAAGLALAAFLAFRIFQRSG